MLGSAAIRKQFIPSSAGVCLQSGALAPLGSNGGDGGIVGLSAVDSCTPFLLLGLKFSLLYCLPLAG